jgi:putative nucleotidyltransferase with HDIG domain
MRGRSVLADSNDVSCINSRAIIAHIRRTHPDRVSELFADLPAPQRDYPDPESFFCEENNWVPSGLIALLFRNACRITENPDVAFDIGFESVKNREFNFAQRLFLTAFSSPRRALKRVNQINMKFNTSKIIELVYDAPGRAVIRWHWKQGCGASKDTCAYNRGIYSAIPTIWGLEPARVVEDTCFFDGGPYCELSFSWSLGRGWLKNFFMRISTRRASLFNALNEIERDKTLLKEKFDQLNTLNLELNEKVSLLKAINNATRALVSEQDIQKVLQRMMQPIVDVLGFSRALIMLIDETGEFLEYRYGVGETEEARGKMAGYRISLNREHNLLVRVLQRKKPIIIRDVKKAGLNPNNRILADFKPTSFIVCPLVAEDKAIGLLGADRGGSGGRVTENDAEFLSILSNSLATSILRARLDEELKTSYVSSVRALVQAIEEKDTYTRGHSERVAAMVVEIARSIGLPEEEVEYLRFGSILHDVGKIGISESIVRSPKILSDAEFKIIQLHTLKGVEILQPITFIKNHLYLIRNHHERYDGKGYPDRLRGEEIPLGAQIVAVADAFDAMTSSRPYRKGLPFKQAAKEIHSQAGTQFSPRIAEAFLKVLEDPLAMKNLSFLLKK